MANNNAVTKSEPQEISVKNMEEVQKYVLSKLTEHTANGELVLPKNYNASNAVKMAWLKIIQDQKIMQCSKQSILESLMNMAILGLSTAQNQCYFIAYGNTAKLSVSYMGKETIIKRITGVFDTVAQPIFDGDQVDYKVKDGVIYDISHSTSFGNRDKAVIGAYAIINLDKAIFGRDKHIEVMTAKELEAAWGMGSSKGATHVAFPQEMGRKSVINRAIKRFISTTNVEEHEMLVVNRFRETTENDNIEYDNNSTEEKLVETKREIDEDTVIDITMPIDEDNVIDAETTEPANENKADF